MPPHPPFFRPDYEKTVDVVLHPPLCADSSFGLTFLKKNPEGLCNSFQVNDLTFARNASEEEIGRFSGYPRLPGANVRGGTFPGRLPHAAEGSRSRSVNFPRPVFYFVLLSFLLNLSSLPLRRARRVRARSPFEMPLFDLTGTGLPTESRDHTLSVEHKQTVG